MKFTVINPFRSTHSQVNRIGWFILAMILTFLGQSAQSATITWSNTAGTTAWATGSNWIGNTAPTSDLTTDIALFDSTSYTNQPNYGTTSVNGIVVGDGSTATASLTLAGTALTLGTSGILINAASGSVALNNAVQLGANQSWMNNSSNLFTVGATIANAGNVTPFTLTIGGTGDTTVSGVISNGGSTGTTAITKTGAGILTLTGSNTYTGVTTISSGTLTTGVVGGLGGSGTTSIASGASLNLTGGGLSYTGLSKVTGSGTINVTLGVGNPTTTLGANFSTFTGVVNLGVGTAGANTTGKAQMNGVDNAGMTINVLSNATLYTNGGGTHNASLVLYGGDPSEALGQLRLDGVTWAGGITLAGAITGGATDGIIGGNSGTSTITGVISESGGSRALNKAGAATIVLSATNTFSGATQILAGTLQLNNSLALQNSALDATVSGTGAASAGLKTTVTTLTLGGLTGTKDFASLFTTTSGGYNGVTALTLNPGNGVTDSYSGIIADGAAGMTLTKTGAGTQVLTGSNTFTGATTISAGTLESAKAATLLNSGTVTVSNAGSTLAANYGGASDYLANNIVTLLAKTVFSSTSTAFGFDTTNASGTYGNNLTMAAGLTKLGANTLTLTGLNTYTGATTISGGTLESANAASLPTSGTITVSNAGSTLAVNYGGASDYQTTDIVTLLGKTVFSSTATAFGFDTTNASGTYGNSLTMTAGLTKLGANTLTLTAANSYTGATTIFAGTLQIGDGTVGNDGSIATSSGIVNNGALIYNLSSTATRTYGNVISGTGSLTKAGAGILNLRGVNTYTGTTMLSAGTLQIGDGTVGNDGSIATSSGIVNNGALIYNLSSTATRTYGNVISGTGSLTKAGGGILTLSGSNAFSGGVNLNAGELIISNSNALSSGTLNIAGGTTLDSSGMTIANVQNWNRDFTYAGSSGALTANGNVTLGGSCTVTVSANTLTVNGVIGDGGSGYGLTKSGVGSLSLTGSNTFTGAVTVNNGVLKLLNSGTSYLAGFSGLNIAPSTGGTATLILDAEGNFLNYPITNGISVTGSGVAVLQVSGFNETFSGGAINLGNHDLTLQHVASTGGPYSTNVSNQLTGTGNLILSDLITNTGVRALTLSGSQNQTGTIAVNNVGTGAQTITLSGVLGAGISALTVNNTTSVAAGQILTLSGANTSFAGTVNVNAGILQIGNGSALNANNIVTVGGNGTAPILDLNGNNQTIAGLNDGGYTTGTVTNSGTLVQTLTLGGTGNYSYAGAITATTPANFNLTKTGTGTQTLTASNSYAGLTSVTGGVLNIQNSSALGTGTASVSSVGALQLQGGITVANSLNLTGSGVSNDGALRSISGSNTYSGLVNVTSASRINSDAGTFYLTTGGITLGNNILTLGGSGNTIVSSILSGSGGLTKDGAGTVTLTNSNSFTGAISVSYGTLSIGDGAAGHDGSIASSSGISLSNPSASLVYNLSSTASRTYSNGIIGTGSLGVMGSGTLTLAGTNTFTGNTLVAGGKLILGNNLALENSVLDTASAAGSITLIGTTPTFGGLTGNGSLASIFTSYGTVTTLTLNNQAGTNSIYSGNIANGAAGMNLAKSGSGTQTLAGSNTYSGATTITGGTLNLSNQNALQNSTLTLSGGGIVFDSSVSGNAFTFGALSAASAGAGYDIALQNNAGTPASVALTVGGNNASTTYAAVLSGSGSLTKTGAGQLTLSASNSYSGNTSVNAGTLTLGNANALGTGTTTVSNGATLNLNGQGIGTRPVIISGTGVAGSALNNGSLNMLTLGGNATVGNSSGLTLASGTLDFGGGNTLTKAGTGMMMIQQMTFANVGSTGSIVVQSGTLKGIFASTMNGTASNSLTLQSGATFWGHQFNAIPWTVNLKDGSTLYVDSNGLSLSGPVSLSGTAILSTALSGGGSIGISGAVSGTGGLNVQNLGTSGISLSGSNTFSGATTLSSGTLTLSNINALQNSCLNTSGTGVITLSSVTTPTFGGLSGTNNLAAVITTGYGSVTSLTLNPGTGASNTYSGIITDGAAGMTLTKTGSGTQILTGSSTYTGATNIKAGTLYVSGSLSSSSPVTVGNSANLSAVATLSGAGSVGNVTVGAAAANTGAELCPSNNAGTSSGNDLTVGSLTIQSGAHLDLQIGRTSVFSAGGGNGTLGGDVSDKVTASGLVTLTSADLRLSLLPSTGYSLAQNDVIFLLINGLGTAVNGTFTSLNGSATNLGEGQVFALGSQLFEITYHGSYSSNSFTGGQDISLMMVPEPSTWTLLTGGLGLLMLARRSRKA